MSALTTCPKCGHTVAPSLIEEICPSCGVVFHKYAARAARLRAQVAPRTTTDRPPGIADDASVWTLVSANAVALVVALIDGWDVVDLMLVYWAQSVLIGASYCARILSLDEFSTENFEINGQAVAPSLSRRPGLRSSSRFTMASFTSVISHSS